MEGGRKRLRTGEVGFQDGVGTVGLPKAKNILPETGVL